MNYQTIYQESAYKHATSNQDDHSDKIPVNNINPNLVQHVGSPMWPPTPGSQQSYPDSSQIARNQFFAGGPNNQNTNEDMTPKIFLNQPEGHDLPIPVRPGDIPGYRNPAFDENMPPEVVSTNTVSNQNMTKKNKRRFWIILGIVLLVILALGIGIALGIVLGRKHRETSKVSAEVSVSMNTVSPGNVAPNTEGSLQSTLASNTPNPTLSLSVQETTDQLLVTSFVPQPSSNAAGSIPAYTTTCTWISHCPGDRCSGNDFCDGSSTCENGVCAWCSERNRCIGDTCGTDDDCSLPWKCVDGVCAQVFRFQAK